MILCLGPTPCYQRTMSFKSVSLDAVNRTSEVHEYASGKSTNVARVLHELDEPVRAITFVGGMRGSAFEGDLLRSGIAYELIRVKPETRMAITIIDRAAGTATELLEESRKLTGKDYDAMLAALEKHLPGARMLVLSGTLPPKAPADFYARCVELAEPNVPVIVDAVGEPLLQALAFRPHAIKPNRSEIERTLGISIASDTDLRKAMQRLIDLGAQGVVVTDGPKATLVHDGERCWRITGPPIQPVSAIGSGDAFAAGLASGLLRNDVLPHAAELGTACGAANALSPHAGHINLEDVLRILKQVQGSEM